MPSTRSGSRAATADELSNLVMNDRLTNLIDQVFNDDPASHAHLQHYATVSRNLRRLEYDLDQVREDQNTLFDRLMTCSRFRNAIKPVIRTERRRMRQARFDPYTRRVLTHSTSSSSSISQPSQASFSQSSSSSSRRSFHSTNDNFVGSSSQPIDVDQFDETKTAKKPIIRPLFPLPDKCPKCEEHGHEDDCLQPIRRPQFRPQCSRCGQLGHNKPECDTRMRSFAFCDTCEWLGRRQRDCDHYDVTPMDIKRLCGDKIPFTISD